MNEKSKYASYEFWLFKVLPWVLYIGAVGYAFIVYMMGKGDMNTVRVVVFVMLTSRILEPVKVIIAGKKENKKQYIVRACIALVIVLLIAGAEWFIIGKAEQAGLRAKELNLQAEMAAGTDKQIAFTKLVEEKSSEFTKWLIAAGVVFVLQIFNELALPDVGKKKKKHAEPEAVESAGISQNDQSDDQTDNQ